MNIAVRLLVIIGMAALISVVQSSIDLERNKRPQGDNSAWAAAVGGSEVRLVIPKIGVNARVYEGVDLPTLAKGPGHFPGTAGPGEIGNFAIAGHRNIHGGRFMFLPKLNPGDEVMVYSGTKQYRYRIYQTRCVQPNELWVTKPVPRKATITLLTCIPVPNPTHRFVAFGELINK